MALPISVAALSIDCPALSSGPSFESQAVTENSIDAINTSLINVILTLALVYALCWEIFVRTDLNQKKIIALR